MLLGADGLLEGANELTFKEGFLDGASAFWGAPTFLEGANNLAGADADVIRKHMTENPIEWTRAVTILYREALKERVSYENNPEGINDKHHHLSPSRNSW